MRWLGRGYGPSRDREDARLRWPDRRRIGPADGWRDHSPGRRGDAREVTAWLAGHRQARRDRRCLWPGMWPGSAGRRRSRTTRGPAPCRQVAHRGPAPSESTSRAASGPASAAGPVARLSPGTGTRPGPAVRSGRSVRAQDRYAQDQALPGYTWDGGTQDAWRRDSADDWLSPLRNSAAGHAPEPTRWSGEPIQEFSPALDYADDGWRTDSVTGFAGGSRPPEPPEQPEQPEQPERPRGRRSPRNWRDRPGNRSVVVTGGPDGQRRGDS